MIIFVCICDKLLPVTANQTPDNLQYIYIRQSVAKKWNLYERNVRNYCITGQIKDAFLTGMPIRRLK